MLRSNMTPGNNAKLLTMEKMQTHGTFSESSDSSEDNSKQLRRDSSLCEQHPRSPVEIMSSIYNDITWSFSRDLMLCWLFYLFGVHGPKKFLLPLMGGLTIRPIPYQVTAAGDVLIDLTLANDLVPKSDAIFYSGKLWFISLWLPLFLLTVIGAMFPLMASAVPNNNPMHNIHAGACTILVSIGISELWTQVFKFYVGRLRPNFYAMCGFDKETLQCMNGDEMEMEARMSFPSGHSSLSFCGLVCVALFFLGRMSGRPGPLRIRSKLMTTLSFTPLLLSFWCATSRLVDNWHHPSDIIAGTILGSISACISYHIWFPQLGSVYAGIPLSALRSDDGIGSDYMIVEKTVSLPAYSAV